MQGLILAAGMGKRLKELTQNNTKCMVKVNGVSLIDRMLHQLDKLQLSRIVIVVGYEGQKLKDYMFKRRFVLWIILFMIRQIIFTHCLWLKNISNRKIPCF